MVPSLRSPLQRRVRLNRPLEETIGRPATLADKPHDRVAREVSAYRGDIQRGAGTGSRAYHKNLPVPPTDLHLSLPSGSGQQLGKPLPRFRVAINLHVRDSTNLITFGISTVADRGSHACRRQRRSRQRRRGRRFHRGTDEAAPVWYFDELLGT